MTKKERLKYEETATRTKSGEIVNQKSYAFIKELNSCSADQLNKVALIDEDRTYTYRQMFRQWDNYAEVFSALDMTGETHTRVGIMPGIAAESLHCFFALNMTGASVSFIPFSLGMNIKQLKKTIEEEEITDLIIADSIFISSVPYQAILKFFDKLLANKEKSGLRHIIVLHVPITSSFVPQKLVRESRSYHEQLRELPEILLMEDLLEKYEAEPIHYGDPASTENSLILHTSGTTRGIPKPVILSDAALNEGVRRFLLLEDVLHFQGTAVTVPPIEPVASYLMVDMVYLPLAFGGTVVLVPQGLASPLYYKAFGYYRANIVFTTLQMLEEWRKLPEDKRPDLSNMKLVAFGGSHLSADNRKKYNALIKEMGSPVRLANCYGLPESCGAVIISWDEDEEDSIGHPLPGVSVKIYDEEEKCFYDLEDGPRTGRLYLSTGSLSSGRIGDTVFYELEEIDGVPYLATYDLVEVHEDGSLTCLRRTN